MKSHPSLRRSVFVLALSLAALPTWASDDCEAPVNRWQSREALRQWAETQGWQVQRLKIDDGCYEIRGTDAQGRNFKAKIDPETFHILKLKPAGHRRDRDRDGGAAPSPLTAPGTAPSGQAE